MLEASELAHQIPSAINIKRKAFGQFSDFLAKIARLSSAPLVRARST